MAEMSSACPGGVLRKKLRRKILGEEEERAPELTLSRNNREWDLEASRLYGEFPNWDEHMESPSPYTCNPRTFPTPRGDTKLVKAENPGESELCLLWVQES